MSVLVIDASVAVKALLAEGAAEKDVAVAIEIWKTIVNGAYSSTRWRWSRMMRS
jgi:hypothetical protein